MEGSLYLQLREDFKTNRKDFKASLVTIVASSFGAAAARLYLGMRRGLALWLKSFNALSRFSCRPQSAKVTAWYALRDLNSQPLDS